MEWYYVVTIGISIVAGIFVVQSYIWQRNSQQDEKIQKLQDAIHKKRMEDFSKKLSDLELSYNETKKLATEMDHFLRYATRKN